MACRCSRPMAMGLCSAPSTQAPSHNSCTGHTRAQLAPSKFASRMVRADPGKFPVEIFLMNFGISMCVGQACVHGASKHIRQRADSTAASFCVSGGSNSPNGFAGAVLCGSTVNTSPCSSIRNRTESSLINEDSISQPGLLQQTF